MMKRNDKNKQSAQIKAIKDVRKELSQLKEDLAVYVDSVDEWIKTVTQQLSELTKKVYENRVDENGTTDSEA